MESVSDGNQSCHFFHLAVSVSPSLYRYQDGFGNHVHHFNCLQAADQVRILAASVVETHPGSRDPQTSQATYPLNLTGASLEVFDFLQFRGPVNRTSRLEPLLRILRPHEGMKVGELVGKIANYINGHFEYAKNSTLVSSPIDDLLEKGKGVCQDFTHLMIALLRTFEVPARYVSGYLHRPGKESQSHAWCEVWLPDQGWVGVDPTNNAVVDDGFVKVAVGRDFTDVPPNKGTYRRREAAEGQTSKEASQAPM